MTQDTASTEIVESFSIPRRLTGWKLILVRFIWLVVVAGCVGLFVTAIPFRIAELQTLCAEAPCAPDQISPQAVELFESVGLSLNFYVAYIFGMEFLVLVVALSVTVLVFWRRSDSWLGLFTSAILVYFLFGIPVTWVLRYQSPVFDTAINLSASLGRIGILYLWFVFPDGRMVPRFMRWILPLFAVLMILAVFLVPVPNTPLSIVPLGVGLVAGAIAQVYRYRRVSGPIQRQQTKWAVFGLVVYVAIVTIIIVVAVLFPDTNTEFAAITTSQQIILRAIMLPILYSGAYFLIICLAIAALGNRLWDIDPIVNRSLVYAALSLFLGAVFVGGFFSLRAILGSLLGSGQGLIAIGLPAVAVTALFTPTRRRVRTFVDRRLYGIELDYRQAGKPLSFRNTDTRTSFGKYTDLEKIGRGGMGEVYRGNDPDTKQLVAIKILPVEHEDKDEMVRRFRREAQTVENLDHPNIVKLYSVGANDGTPFMVMEYIDGYDLSTMLRMHGRVTLDDLLPILTGIASALDYAHQQGIVHRDIKPSNVMIEQDTNRPVLMDFGIARIASAMTQLTGTGGMIGTLDYISPEQIQGQDNIDGRADVYSLGVMTYQLLTGQLPFKKVNAAALVMAHLIEPPPDPGNIAPNLSANASKAIMRAMAKNPKERFESVSVFINALG